MKLRIPADIRVLFHLDGCDVPLAVPKLSEFQAFIGEDMRLEPIILTKETSIDKLLKYYMGKNTPERQEFIIDNLYIEKDITTEEKVVEPEPEEEEAA